MDSFKLKKQNSKEYAITSVVSGVACFLAPGFIIFLAPVGFLSGVIALYKGKGQNMAKGHYILAIAGIVLCSYFGYTVISWYVSLT